MTALRKKSPADDVLHWTSSFTGIRIMPRHPGGPAQHVGAPAGKPAANDDPRRVPRPMPPGTKVVHGKVPGPANHLLTTPDGFVADVTAKTIIANSLADYVKAKSAPAAPAAHVPAAAKPAPDAGGDKDDAAAATPAGGGGRCAVAAAAKAMMGRGTIHGRARDQANLRQGWEDLLEIFQLAAPAFAGRPGWVDTVLKQGHEVGTTNGIPHWCGIFALYATKTGGVSVGTWKPGTGIGGVSGFRVIKPGEVGVGDVVVKKANVHHAVVIAVDGDKVTVVNGNSGGDSSITQSSGRIADYDGGCYSAF